MSQPIVEFPIPTTPFANLGAGKQVYLSNFSSGLAAAVATLLLIGEPVTLNIDVATPVPANLNITSPIVLTRSNTGLITVAAGKTLYVELPPDVGDQQIFALADATASVTFGDSASAVRLAWFTGPNPTDVSNALNVIHDALTTTAAGSVIFPAAQGMTVDGTVSMPSSILWIGQGQEATKITLTGGANAGLINIPGNLHNVVIRDMTHDGGGNGGDGAYCTGAAPNSSGGLHYENVLSQNFANKLSIIATDGGLEWQLVNVTYDKACAAYFNDNGLRCNAVNTNVEDCSYKFTEPGAFLANLDAIGEYRLEGEQALAGGASNYGQNQTESQTFAGVCTVSGTAKCVVIAANMRSGIDAQTSGLLIVGHTYIITNRIAPDSFLNVGAASNTTGTIFTATNTTPSSYGAGSTLTDLSQTTVDIPLNTGDHTTSAKVANAFKTALGNSLSVGNFFAVGGDPDTTLGYLIALDPAANDSLMNFSIVPNGTGITASPTSTNAAAGVAATLAHGVRINGLFDKITFISQIDEGFDYLFKNTHDDLGKVVDFVSCRVQSSVQLDKGCTVNVLGGKFANRTIREGYGYQSQVNNFGALVPTYAHYAGLNTDVYQWGMEITNFFLWGVMGMNVNEHFHRLISQYAMYLLTGPANNVSTTEAVLNLLNQQASTKPMLRIGRADQINDPLINAAYYDFFRDNVGTYALGYLCILASQAAAFPAFVGLYLNFGMKAFGLLASSPSFGVGYAAGAGGTVTQANTSGKATTTVLNTACGNITTDNAALAAATIVSFTFTNTSIGLGDVLVLNHVSGGTIGAYSLNAQCAAGSATINIRNNTAGSLSEALVIGFAIIKGATS